MMPYIEVTYGNESHDLMIDKIVSVLFWNSAEPCCKIYVSIPIPGTYNYYTFRGSKEALYAEISRAMHRQNFDKGFQDLVDS